MLKTYLKEIWTISHKNNKILLLIWIKMTSVALWYIIILLIIINAVALLKFAYLYKTADKKIYITPNESILDNLILKFVCMWKIKKNKKDFFIFFFFSYLIVFMFKISLKSISISIKTYNLLKSYYYGVNSQSLYDALRDIEFKSVEMESTSIKIFKKELIPTFQTY